MSFPKYYRNNEHEGVVRDLNKLYSSDIPVLITNNFAIIMIKKSGGEVFPPMGQMIPSMGNFRNQKSHTGHKWRYADQILKTGRKQKKNYIFYYLLSAVWTLRLKYLLQPGTIDF